MEQVAHHDKSIMPLQNVTAEETFQMSSTPVRQYFCSMMPEHFDYLDLFFYCLHDFCTLKSSFAEVDLSSVDCGLEREGHHYFITLMR